MSFASFWQANANTGVTDHNDFVVASFELNGSISDSWEAVL